MDNNGGENFLGGGPPSRNNNSRDGSEFPGNLFSPGLRAVSEYLSFDFMSEAGWWDGGKS
jgi:hypothetical protein